MNIYKKNISLLIVFVVYLITLLLTLFITNLFTFNNEWTMILFSHSLATILIYISSVTFNNSSMYDPFWSVAPIPIILYLGFYSPETILDNLYKFIVIVPVIFWALRLTHNWTLVWDGLNEEDFRYIDLKKGNTLKKEVINFFGIHYIPTLQVNVSLLPIYFIFINIPQNIFWLLFGSFVSFIAVILQIISDKQMRDFKKDITNKGKVNDIGLWHYSRHPNYLGEVIFWFGLYFMALSIIKIPSWLILCPLSMLVLFVFISCPMMDERSLKRRPDYMEYMKQTSQLLLLPKFKQKKMH
jgi:steroid 5-alpha reductase family enzyme